MPAYKKYIPAEKWNKLAAISLRNRLVSGDGIIITKTTSGATISIDDSPYAGKHPWRMNIDYDYELECWLGRFSVAGFVNGHDPIVQVPAKDGPKKDKIVEVRLTDEGLKSEEFPEGADPYLKLTSFFDSSMLGAGFPDYFLGMGVKKPDDGSAFNTFLGGESVQSLSKMQQDEEDYGNRTLLSCDVVLSVDKYGTTTDVTPANPLLGIAEKKIMIPLSPPNRYPLRLRTMNRYEPLGKEAQDLLSALLGTSDEPTYKDFLIARVWFLSPEKPPENTEFDETKPDSSWETFVQYFMTWNLNGCQPHIKAQNLGNDITFNIPLAGGVANSIINSQLSEINSSNAAALAAVSASDYTYEYWSP